MKRRKERDDSQIEYLPTPEQIAADTAEIRKSWGLIEEKRRSAKPKDETSLGEPPGANRDFPPGGSENVGASA